MGCLGSKDRLTKEDMEFLKTHTRYDEATIKEWYKGFKVCILVCVCAANAQFIVYYLIKQKQFVAVCITLFYSDFVSAFLQLHVSYWYNG